MDVCLQPTHHLYKRQTNITVITNIKEKPILQAFNNPLLKLKYERVNIIITSINQIPYLKTKEVQSFDIVCAICNSPEIARACSGFVDLVQLHPSQLSMTFLSAINDQGTQVEILINNINFKFLDFIRRISRNGKGVIFTGSQLSFQDKQIFLEVLGYNLQTIKKYELKLLKSCASRKYRACDGVGFL
ncbi:hypothetical protein SS50377_21248 [Spironucleus salmonicida]|uniref:Uncharacterized protein n=1 Tax=Spironucleus salmonicida TaxID=348837 RepID=V6LJX0_9EUKA|nr:hypothetical protein SS50377_21248 [Spironucleus salmonicida]|eukprot:EST44021.1 Hypothetical protein SS50377_16330 [Spironucleus salmonicida]